MRHWARCTFARWLHFLSFLQITQAFIIYLSDNAPESNFEKYVHMQNSISSVQFSSVTQSCPTLWPHESQHARPPCPSPSPGVHSDSRPSSPWCHPAISFLVVPFSSCPQSLPASESFPMSQLFSWGGQSTGDMYVYAQITHLCEPLYLFIFHTVQCMWS